MSEIATDIDAHTDDEVHHHPSDWAYVKIAVILGAITAVEVSTYFSSVVDYGDALIPMLLVMMVVKFYLVVMWFMHLKFDTPVFRTLFAGGLVLAAVIYIATLSAFEFWA